MGIFVGKSGEFLRKIFTRPEALNELLLESSADLDICTGIFSLIQTFFNTSYHPNQLHFDFICVNSSYAVVAPLAASCGTKLR